MSDENKHFGVSLVTDDEIQKLERLLADLKRIRSGEGPMPEDLVGAPLIDPFSVTQRQSTCLTGYVVGHPRLGDTNVLTTDIWAFAPAVGWARTFSRYYRLGRMHSGEERMQ